MATPAWRSRRQVIEGAPPSLKPRMYYDCNPPSKAHWTYKLFVQKRTRRRRSRCRSRTTTRTSRSTRDNADNLARATSTRWALSARMRKRFLKGEFADATPNQLFPEEHIDKWRVMDGTLPDFVRVVVGVDPSGSGDEDNADNDAIGIVVAGSARTATPTCSRTAR
jgi:phage terminase large subunit-like protein